MTSLMAQRLQKPMAYLRPRPKLHGKQRQLEGLVRPGDQAMLVSNDPLTEQSIVDSKAIVRKQQGKVSDVLAISDRVREDQSSARQGGALSEYLRPLELGARHRDLELGTGRKDGAKNSGIPLNSAGLEFLVQQNTEEHRRRVAEVLLQINAVTLNRAQPYRFVSGLLSPIYADNRLLISHPKEWRVVIQAFLHLIRRIVHAEDINLIAGTATAGIPHASLIADELDLPFVYVASEENGTVGKSEIVGELNAGNRAIIIEDHVTTGKSGLSAVNALRQNGAQVQWCVAIFTYDEPGMRNVFNNKDIQFAALCDLPTLVDVAVEKGVIDSADRYAVLEWVQDPVKWTANEEASGRTAGGS